MKKPDHSLLDEFKDFPIHLHLPLAAVCSILQILYRYSLEIELTELQSINLELINNELFEQVLNQCPQFPDIVKVLMEQHKQKTPKT